MSAAAKLPPSVAAVYRPAVAPSLDENADATEESSRADALLAMVATEPSKPRLPPASVSLRDWARPVYEAERRRYEDEMRREVERRMYAYGSGPERIYGFTRGAYYEPSARDWYGPPPDVDRGECAICGEESCSYPERRPSRRR